MVPQKCRECVQKTNRHDSGHRHKIESAMNNNESATALVKKSELRSISHAAPIRAPKLNSKVFSCTVLNESVYKVRRSRGTHINNMYKEQILMRYVAAVLIHISLIFDLFEITLSMSASNNDVKEPCHQPIPPCANNDEPHTAGDARYHTPRTDCVKARLLHVEEDVKLKRYVC